VVEPSIDRNCLMVDGWLHREAQDSSVLPLTSIANSDLRGFNLGVLHLKIGDLKHGKKSRCWFFGYGDREQGHLPNLPSEQSRGRTGSACHQTFGRCRGKMAETPFSPSESGRMIEYGPFHPESDVDNIRPVFLRGRHARLIWERQLHFFHLVRM
jgi:hypothetical protein